MLISFFIFSLLFTLYLLGTGSYRRRYQCIWCIGPLLHCEELHIRNYTSMAGTIHHEICRELGTDENLKSYFLWIKEQNITQFSKWLNTYKKKWLQRYNGTCSLSGGINFCRSLDTRDLERKKRKKKTKQKKIIWAHSSYLLW